VIRVTVVPSKYERQKALKAILLFFFQEAITIRSISLESSQTSHISQHATVISSAWLEW